MPGFFKQIHTLINEADIILEIVDARFADKTRNKQIEEVIIQKGKTLIIAINKSDLVTKQEIAKAKSELIKSTKSRVVFVSAKEKNGIRLLKREIGIAKGSKKELIIGLLGYPNAGKSTIINGLSGKGMGKVKTSPKAGYTRGLQRIKIAEGIYLIDAPGIIPYDERDEFKLFIFGAKNPNQLKDIESAGFKLVEALKDRIKTVFEVEGEDEEEILEAIGKKKKMFAKGGKVDLIKTARFVLEKYQKNEL